jgi:hypothetical protein
MLLSKCDFCKIKFTEGNQFPFVKEDQGLEDKEDDSLIM